MLSQTFFVKVDPSLQAKVPLHPGCIYTFEPVTEAGPYDERNKSYLQLVNKSAVPPGDNGIFRVIASRGVVTIQRDEYTPVALNSFIDRCDPNADVSYDPSGRPFPFEKVTPVVSTNPRHPYALCLKKHEAEAHYFYPGARVELDHIVNVAAAAQKAADAAAAAAGGAGATATAGTPVAGAVGPPPSRAGAAGGGGVAPSSRPAPADWKAEMEAARKDGRFNVSGVYGDLGATLNAMLDDTGPLANIQDDEREALLLDVVGLIKELYDRSDLLLVRFAAEVAELGDLVKDSKNTDFERLKLKIKEVNGKIQVAPLKVAVDALKSLAGLAEYPGDSEDIQRIENVINGVQSGDPKAVTAMEAQRSKIRSVIERWSAAVGGRFVEWAKPKLSFYSNDTRAEIQTVLDSLGQIQNEYPDESINQAISVVDKKQAGIRRDAECLWNATEGLCGENEDGKDSLDLLSTSARLEAHKAMPDDEFELVTAVVTGMTRNCDYSGMGIEVRKAMGHKEGAAKQNKNVSAANAAAIIATLASCPLAQNAMTVDQRKLILTARNSATRNVTATNAEATAWFRSTRNTIWDFGGKDKWLPNTTDAPSAGIILPR